MPWVLLRMHGASRCILAPAHPVSCRTSNLPTVTPSEALSNPHTGPYPGSICLWSEADKVLISGDTVFTDGAFGRYDFPGGSRQALERSLDQLGQLDVEGLYPGHGEPVDCGGKRHIAAARQLMKAGYG